MHKNLLILFGITFVALCSSCKQTTLKEELREWCACQQQTRDFPEKLDSCNQIMGEISKKYEYDPESLPEIEQAVNNCK